MGCFVLVCFVAVIQWSSQRAFPIHACLLLEGLETLFPWQGQCWGLMLGVPCVGQEAGGAGAAGEEEAGGGPDG